MDTPITVSSTSTSRLANNADFLQFTYNRQRKHDESVITIDSNSFERVPVSWRSDSDTTLTNIQKVSNWIKSIEGTAGNCDLDLGNSFCSESTTPQLTRKKNDNNAKSLIVFRCDFEKSVPVKTPSVNPFEQPAKQKCHHENENKFKEVKNASKLTSTSRKITNSMDESSKTDNFTNNTTYYDKKHVILKRTENSNLINYPTQINGSRTKTEIYSQKIVEEKSDGSSDNFEVPLSPESRKKELCSYLQLMNPADKKEILIIQNRRSTRVRNLAAMQEQRQIARKIRESEEDTDHSEREVDKCSTLKSFKELNIRVEKSKFRQEDLLEDKILISASEKDSFCFPFPSEILTAKTDHFDSTMAKLIPRFKRICKLKNLKLKTRILNNTLTKNLAVNKEFVKKKRIRSNGFKNEKTMIIKNSGRKKNITNKDQNLKKSTKKKYKRLINSERSNSLRSTGRLKNVPLKKLLVKKEKELMKVVKVNKPTLQKPIANKEKKSDLKNKIGRNELQKLVEEKTPKQKLPENPSPKTSSRRRSKSVGSQCEIVTVAPNNEDHLDLEQFMDDMDDFNNLSEEHKKCLIETRILSGKPLMKMPSTKLSNEEISKSFSSLQAISPLYGFEIEKVQKICETYNKTSLLTHSNVEVVPKKKEKLENIKIVDSTEHKTDKTNTNSKKSPTKTSSQKASNVNGQSVMYEIEDVRGKNKSQEIKSNQPHDLTNGVSLLEHDYAGLRSDEENEEDKEIDVVTVPSKNIPVPLNCIINAPVVTNTKNYELLPYNKEVEMKSLHRSLQFIKRKNNNVSDPTLSTEWESDSSIKQKLKRQSHYISINKEQGAILKAFYIDYNLILCQEYEVSFWMQTPLGNVLGSQNMWVPRGQTARLVINSKCIQKESMEMVISMESNVAYVELWTKEHKSEIREGPVADVFATLYFWKQRQNGLEKKVLQLENINGFADDVQYSVMKCSPKIIVSWHSANEDNVGKKTFIHAYQLAPDYQTVSNIYDIEPVDHYVSSLHNIEDCENLIMGCGENKITLWNVEYGYIIATIELSEIKSPLSTLWVKCDRGFLFALQQCVDRELRLIAINGMNHSWKKLASYNPPEGFDRLRGVCIENGLLLSFYDQGILCWKAETGEPVEETTVEAEIIPSGKYIILLDDNQIIVKHAITHLMSMSIDDS